MEEVVKTLQVFDCLNMPHELFEELAADFEVRDGSYRRWYPNKTIYQPEYFDQVNDWLLNQGMVIDENNKYFYVLLYFSW